MGRRGEESGTLGKLLGIFGGADISVVAGNWLRVTTASWMSENESPSDGDMNNFVEIQLSGIAEIGWHAAILGVSVYKILANDSVVSYKKGF